MNTRRAAFLKKGVRKWRDLETRSSQLPIIGSEDLAGQARDAKARSSRDPRLRIVP